MARKVLTKMNRIMLKKLKRVRMREKERWMKRGVR
tara:strand:- start:402 stop:506 length:105 start_codon:yes stop_codon:yes gene_type:complete